MHLVINFNINFRKEEYLNTNKNILKPNYAIKTR